MKKFFASLVLNFIVLILMSPLAMASNPAANICTIRGLSVGTTEYDSCISEQNAIYEEGEAELLCDKPNVLQIDDLSALLGATDASYIATEIYEPIGGFDTKIKAGTITLAQTFWKFNCSTQKISSWTDNSTVEKIDADPERHTFVTVSGYVPYEDGCPTTYDKCSIVQVIIGQSGTAILKTYVALIYRWAAGIVGIIAVLVIVLSGIQISADQGGGENLSAAKTRISQSLAGLVILFLASLILYTINPTFFK